MKKKYQELDQACGIKACAVGAASQRWSNKRMMVYFKLMMVKCESMMVKWVYYHIIISPSMTSISPSLTSISPSLTRILPSLAWSKPSFACLTIVEKLHRLMWRRIWGYYKWKDTSFVRDKSMIKKTSFLYIKLQCFGSVSFWCGSWAGSADPLPGWWIRIRPKIEQIRSDRIRIRNTVKLHRIVQRKSVQWLYKLPEGIWSLTPPPPSSFMGQKK